MQVAQNQKTISPQKGSRRTSRGLSPEIHKSTLALNTNLNFNGSTFDSKPVSTEFEKFIESVKNDRKQLLHEYHRAIKPNYSIFRKQSKSLVKSTIDINTIDTRSKKGGVSAFNVFETEINGSKVTTPKIKEPRKTLERDGLKYTESLQIIVNKN